MENKKEMEKKKELEKKEMEKKKEEEKEKDKDLPLIRQQSKLLTVLVIFYALCDVLDIGKLLM